VINILYVHHGKGIGGAPLSLLYLIRGLDKARFKPTVLCIHESEAAELFRQEGIETIVLKNVKDFSHTNVLWYPWWQLPKIIARLAHLPSAIARAEAFLATRRFDIVHLNSSPLIAFAIAAKRLGLKVVQHIREPLSAGYFGWRRNLVRRIIDRNSDLIIPICGYDSDQLIPSDKIHVVYNFIDFALFDAAISPRIVRDELKLPDTAKVVLFLGGANRIKGTSIFIEAAGRIAAKRESLHFLIAGEIPGRTFRNVLNGSWGYARKCRQLIPSALQDRIRFIGVRKDIPQLLAAADLLCFPSTTPHFARPVIEASAMGKPVIASDLGGPQELVLHKKTGLLVPASDTGALTEAMEMLLNAPKLADEYGRKGMEFAREMFDSQKNTRKIIQLYKELLGSETDDIDSER
jgi:glycosyltransferase involved in cell wall biosynthesis